MHQSLAVKTESAEKTKPQAPSELLSVFGPSSQLHVCSLPKFLTPHQNWHSSDTTRWSKVSQMNRVPFAGRPVPIWVPLQTLTFSTLAKLLRANKGSQTIVLRKGKMAQSSQGPDFDRHVPNSAFSREALFTAWYPPLFVAWYPPLFGAWYLTLFGAWYPTLFGAWYLTLFGAWYPTLFGAWYPTLFGAWYPMLFGAWYPTLFGAWYPPLLCSLVPGPSLPPSSRQRLVHLVERRDQTTYTVSTFYKPSV